MKIKSVLLILTLLSGLKLLAQKPLPSDTFRVVKAYRPEVIEANKVQFNPEIDDNPQKIEQELSYQFLTQQVPVSFEIEPISPAKIKGEPLIKLYNGYARLGVGNALIPLAEVYYNNLRSKKYALGTHVKYQSLKELNSIKNSDMSELHAAVFGSRFWKRNILDGSIDFDMRKFNYYGYHQIPDQLAAQKIENPDIDQQYNRFSTNVGMRSTVKDSFNLRHEVNVRYGMMTAKNNTEEHQVLTTAQLSQFHNQEFYQLDLSWDYNQYDFSSNNSIIALKPQISTLGNNFRIKAGLGIYVNASTEADFYFYPLAEVNYNAVEDYFVPYAGVNGQVRRNNYQSITLENPFVAEGLVIGNSNEKYNLYGGFRGNLSKSSSFNLNANYKEVESEYFYVKTYPGSSFLSDRFTLIYDDLTELKFKGEMAFHINEKIDLYLQGEYNEYTTDQEEEAWHRPQLKISSSGTYNLADKIMVRLDLFYWGEQFAKSTELTNGIARIKAESLDPIFDANLGFEYRYTKKLSAFLNFNNIGGVRYEKYQDYPTQGFNVLGGLTYAF